MTTNEDITLDSNIMWYLDTRANGHMSEHKYLFVIQEIQDVYVSFEDSTNIPIKSQGKTCFFFFQKDEKKVLWRMSIMYLT